jgi:hypothetical protein
MALYNRNVGPKKTLTCTLATATWVADGSTIPATDSTRWGRTLQAADFPSWSFQPESVKYIGRVLVCVYNTSGSSQTISWKMYKNGSQVTAGTKATSNNVYCKIAVYFYNVSVGDVLEVAVWTASNTNVTVTGSLYHVVPTRLLPTSKTCIDISVTYTLETHPSPLNTAPWVTTIYIGNNISTTIDSTVSHTFNCLSFVSQNNYGMYKYGIGESYLNSASVLTDTGYAIFGSPYLSTISYREIRRGV